MVSTIISAAALALAAARLASAQTSTLCNPLKTSCPPDPAFGGTVSVDFTQGASDLFKPMDGTSLTYDPNNGAAFSISQPSQAPTIISTKYLFFGKVDAYVMAAPGTGIVSSFVLQSDDLDEIDWEWLGGDNTQVQTNYYSKGDTSTYDRGGFSSVGNPTGQFHKYTINWTPQALTWSIDDAVVRTLNYGDAKGGSTYPQTPMQIKLGTWDGGAPDEAPGTVQWAGGYTNFNSAPFVAYVKSLTITDYGNGVSGAGQYSYGDQSGTYGSIKIGGGGSGSSSSSSSSGTASGTASKTGTQTGTATGTATATTATTTSVNSTSTTTTTMSTSTVSNSTTTMATTTTVAPPTSSAASTTAAASATGSAAPKSSAGRVGLDLANAALVVAAVFGYLSL